MEERGLWDRDEIGEGGRAELEDELEADMAAMEAEHLIPPQDVDDERYRIALNSLDSDVLGEILLGDRKGFKKRVIEKFEETMGRKQKNRIKAGKTTSIPVVGFPEIEQEIIVTGMQTTGVGAGTELAVVPTAPTTTKPPTPPEKVPLFKEGKLDAEWEKVVNGRKFLLAKDGTLVMERSGICTGYVRGDTMFRNLMNAETFTPTVTAVKKEWMPTQKQLKRLWLDVLSKFKHEVMVYLFIERKDEQEKLFFFVPEQTVQQAHVQVTGGGIETVAAQWVGDIHTHPWPGTPNASGTDMTDMRKVMGVHGICSSLGEYRWYASLKDHVATLGEVDTRGIKDEDAEPIDLRTFENRPVADLMKPPVQVTHHGRDYSGFNRSQAGTSTSDATPNLQQVLRLESQGYQKIPRDWWPLPGTWVVSPMSAGCIGQVCDVNYPKGTCCFVNVWGTRYWRHPLECLYYLSAKDIDEVHKRYGAGARSRTGDIYVPYNDTCLLALGKVPGSGDRMVPVVNRVERIKPGHTRITVIPLTRREGDLEAYNPDVQGTLITGATGVQRIPPTKTVTPEKDLALLDLDTIPEDEWKDFRNQMEAEDKLETEWPKGTLVLYPHGKQQLYGVVAGVEGPKRVRIKTWGQTNAYVVTDASKLKRPTANQSVIYDDGTPPDTVGTLFKEVDQGVVEVALLGDLYVPFWEGDVWKVSLSQRHGGKKHLTTVVVTGEGLKELEGIPSLVIRSKVKLKEA